MDALVLCYRTVSSPDNLLDTLILRYGSGVSHAHIQNKYAKTMHRLFKHAQRACDHQALDACGSVGLHLHR